MIRKTGKRYRYDSVPFGRYFVVGDANVVYFTDHNGLGQLNTLAESTTIHRPLKSLRPETICQMVILSF